MPEVEWALTQDAPVKEKFGGTIKVRTLWQAPNGATAQGRPHFLFSRPRAGQPRTEPLEQGSRVR